MCAFSVYGGILAEIVRDIIAATRELTTSQPEEVNNASAEIPTTLPSCDAPEVGINYSATPPEKINDVATTSTADSKYDIKVYEISSLLIIRKRL